MDKETKIQIVIIAVLAIICIAFATITLKEIKEKNQNPNIDRATKSREYKDFEKRDLENTIYNNEIDGGQE